MVLLDIVMPVMDGFEVLQEMTDRKLIEPGPCHIDYFRKF